MSKTMTDFTLVAHQCSKLPCATAHYAGLLRKTLGEKGASLWELSNKMNMPVPSFCCVTTAAFTETLHYNGLHQLTTWLLQPKLPLPLTEARIRKHIMACQIPETLTTELTLFIAEHPDCHFVVRSSGTVKEGVESSVASLFPSVFNVHKISDIVQAIKTCWCSLFNERVQTYIAQKHGVTPLGMAVVIQQLIPAEKSGVLFTVDPGRGADTEMLIEATFGLGEVRRSGTVTPDLYRYDWYQEKECKRQIAEKEYQCIRIDAPPFVRLEPLASERARQMVLSVTEVRELAALGLNIQTLSGFPVDIEWAYADHRFYILQSRPVTRFGYTAVDGEWTTAGYRDGGISSSVCTPYMASLYKYVLDATMGAYLQQSHLSPARGCEWQKTFFGRPYWNLGEVKKCLAHIPGFNERVFDEELGITPRYQDDGIVSRTTLKTGLTGIKARLTICRRVRQKLNISPVFVRQQHRRLKELAAMDFSAMPDDALFQFYQSFIRKEFFCNESTYFNFVYDHANLSRLFKDEVKKTTFDMSQFPLLLSSLSSVSHMASIGKLWQLRDKITADPDIHNYWQQNSSTTIAADLHRGETHHLLDEVQVYLQDFGHHSRQELDILVPRYAEMPEAVIEQIQDVLQQETQQDPRIRNSRQQLKMDAVKKTLLRSVSPFRRHRMHKKLSQVRNFLWWREVLRDLSIRFYLYIRQITLEVEARLLNTGMLTQKNDVFFLTITDLIAIVRGDMSLEATQQRIRKNRDYYLSFAGYRIANEVGERYSILSSRPGDMTPAGTRSNDDQTLSGADHLISPFGPEPNEMVYPHSLKIHE